MIANFFNKTKPINILSIIVLLFVYYVVGVFFQNYEAVTIALVFKKITIFFLFTLLLLFVNFIIKKNKLTFDNSYALLLIVFLLGIFFETMNNPNIVISNLILLFGFRKIYSLRSDLNTKKKIFDAGFWVAIATLIYFWSIIYVVLIYVAIITYNKVNIKNVIIPIVGFFTPILLYFTYNFYVEGSILFLNKVYYEVSFVFHSYNSLKLLIPITLLVSILLWSIFSITPKLVLASKRLKLSWNVLINHLIISLIVVVLASVKNGSEMLFLFFPLSIVITIFLQTCESIIIKNLILYVCFAISVGVYFL